MTVTRTGYTGDLGYEVWCAAPDALTVWDALWEASDGNGVLPYGLAALYMLRIEAGLLLLGKDFDSTRFAFNDAHRSTPLELGWAWMFKGLADDDRAFIGRNALEREIAAKSSRWKMSGLVVDWEDYDRVYGDAGLIPPKAHAPVHEDWMVYDDEGKRVGYATSFMYSPVLQRHIAMARIRPDLAKVGNRVFLEFTVDHHYQKVAAHVARLPLFNPERKTAMSNGASEQRSPDGPIRRDRGRRRPQRAGQRRLPGPRRAEDARSSSSGTWSAARPSPRSSAPGSGSRPSRTPCPCSGRRSSRSWS